MKRKIRFMFPLLLLSLPLTGCDFITIKDKEDDTVNVNKYYEGLDLEDSGGPLALALQEFMFEKHTKWITYGQVDSYYSKTTNRNSVEAIADGSNKNQFFYTGKEASGKGTREHVWPCVSSGGLWTHDKPSSGFSQYYVDNSSYIGGGSDLFHIRTCTSSINTARGSASFVDFDDPEFEGIKGDVVSYGENNGKWDIKIYGASQTSTGGYTYANLIEPDDNMKGDIARIVTYVWVHYHNRGFYPTGSQVSGGNKFEFKNFIGNIPLTQVMGYADYDRAKETLMEWNKLDPVSEVEKLRNNTVQKIQGNRNPFVDYPNLIDQLFE